MDDSERVRVAVNVRPLITPELLNGCTDYIAVVPGEPQVQIGSHSFTYDYVYGSKGSPSASSIYVDCVAPLVDALFHGYNATVLAYGQTGSGKTYTMGTNYTREGSSGGIVPKVMESIFKRVEITKQSIEFLIRVSFIEILKEEVFDLLDPNSGAFSEGGNFSKPAVPARVPIQIREKVNGRITLAGVTEPQVRTKEEMASYLSGGSLSRATGSTNMNSQSSRSHAIFTITIEQKKIVQCQPGISNDDIGDDILCAKLHLVDLAGSERAKRTGADHMRLKEGIHINKGLLALGNVISALGNEKKRKEGGHVPYRDSKLTCLLQNSLGGNSKTVMIACVSPAETNAEETLNTLKYANRARNIRNKAVVNRDPVAAQMQIMRSQIEQLQAELLFYHGDASMPSDELLILKQKVSLLEARNADLQQKLHEHQATCEHLTERAIAAQVDKDKLIMQIKSARNGKSWDKIESNSNQEMDLVKSYESNIQELEGELLHWKTVKRSQFVDCVDSDDDGFHLKTVLFPPPNELSSNSDWKAMDISEESEDEEELEHTSLQEKLDKKLKEMDKKMEQKEAEMKHFTNVDTLVLKQHYEKKVLELEQEKKVLQKEIEELRYNLTNISSTSNDGAQCLKEEYLQKLTILEAQVAELKKKQDAQAQLSRQKQKSDKAAKCLQVGIQRIKSQKVQLQQKIKQESEQFRLWRASREKEVIQLRKEGRRNEYEIHKLLALNQRQKMFLQRKTEGAAMATKRLKELLESRKNSSWETSGAGNVNGPEIQPLMRTIELELEVTVRMHEVQAEYDHQLHEKARMDQEIAKLKEESEMLKQTELSDCSPTLSPGAINSRIFALENMLATSSSTLVSMATQLSEAEECERGFSGKRCWNQVQSLANARNLMNHLLNLASSSREKDSEIRELKEKVMKLSSLLRCLEKQKVEVVHQVKSQNSALEKYTIRGPADPQDPDLSFAGCKYDLCKQAVCQSVMLLEDMDTSKSEHSDMDNLTDDERVKSEKPQHKKRNSKARGHSSAWDLKYPENYKSDSSGDGITVIKNNRVPGACCTCSKSSCQCRAAGGICGTTCGCSSTKCSNRDGVLIELDDSAQPEIVEGAVTSSGSAEAEKNWVLASHGALLLQSALVDKPCGPTDGCGVKRKPLSDIGNTVAKSNVPKTNQRKKWRKSAIQLIPVAPPSTESENNESLKNNEAAKKPDNATSEPDIPLKLPKAMRSAAPNYSVPLRERNADQAEESVNKDTGVHPGRSPFRPPRSSTSDEKENYSR